MKTKPQLQVVQKFGFEDPSEPQRSDRLNILQSAAPSAAHVHHVKLAFCHLDIFYLDFIYFTSILLKICDSLK